MKIIAGIVLIVASAVGSTLASHETRVHSLSAPCSLAPSPSILLLTVIRDTVLRHGFENDRSQDRGWPGVKYADANSLMPAASVQLLDADSATRTLLAIGGNTMSAPVFILAAPYAPDCRTIEWTDTVPWVLPGDSDFARATLLPKDIWIDGRAMFDFELAMDAAARSGSSGDQGESNQRDSAISWVKRNTAAAELEPLCTRIADMVSIRTRSGDELPTRLRGSYRISVRALDGAKPSSFNVFFRSSMARSTSWREREEQRAIADILASRSPISSVLTGVVKASRDSLPLEVVFGGSGQRTRIFWHQIDSHWSTCPLLLQIVSCSCQ